MHQVDIRTPTIDDAEAVGRMHARAWREAYGALRLGSLPELRMVR